MDVYFMRHGPADSREGWHGDDADRPLTRKGRKLTEDVARRLAGLLTSVDVILTSPFARAAATADILADALSARDKLVSEPLLEPGFGTAELRQLLERHASAEAIVLVGHEDDFSTVVGQLIGGARLRLKKSGVAFVELPDASSMQGTLRWLIPPEALARPAHH